MNFLRTTFLLVAVLSLHTVTGYAQLQVNDLQCEYKKNPLGMDVMHPRLGWQIESSDNNTRQTAYQIRAAHSIDGLKNEGTQLWNTGKVNSDNSIHIEYDGSQLESREQVYWQVRVWDNHNNESKWSAPSSWEMGLLEPSQWQASWITPDAPEDTMSSQPAPYMRNSFELGKKVKSARAYVTSLGLYELYLNGKKVSDQVFTPGWTSYNKRLQYQTYDITDQLSKGSNAVGAILGDGWYRGQISWEDYNRNRYGTRLALLMQIEVTYTDGSKEMITSGRDWKTATGPIIKSDIYDGEKYDARKKFEGWTNASFDDSKWSPVHILDHTKQTLEASYGPPVKVIQEIEPKKIVTTPKGEKVLDLGQNMVGWVRLKVNGERGDKVTLKFAEVLDEDGNFYTANLRKADNIDTYTLKGGGEEIFRPHFTFHGFRYVKVENYPGELTKNDITGEVIHSDMQRTGEFHSSNPLVNQLWHNLVWSQKGNFLDVPTDCPQRDERLGWTGDAQVFAPTAAYNYNVATFFTKWLRDLAADQTKSGMVPDVVPDVLNINGDPAMWSKPYWGGSTGWADAAIVIPWNLYLYYGDKRVLKRQYESMKSWIEYMRQHAGDDFIWDGGKHYGDWLSYNTTDSDYPGAYTDKDFIATAYYAHSTNLMSKIANILGKEEDAEDFRQLFANIKQAFNHEYVTPDVRLMSNTQTAYSLALKFDLLPESETEKAADHLAEQVKQFGHITTGFLGTPIICPVLSQTDHDSLAYMLLNRKQYPSWLYPVTQGATTIWERWDGIKPDGTFQSIGMNSFNHYAYGAIGNWLYRTVAGIEMDTDQPGFKHILLHPHPGGGLTSTRASYESMYGKIVSDWQIKDGQMEYRVEVPANTTAHIRLPNADINAVKVGDKSLEKSAVMLQNSLKKNEGNTTLEVGSGSYLFSYPYAN